MARTILLDSKLSSRFWPFAYDYACHTQNRIRRRGYDYDSPFHRVSGKLPDYSKLHPFGIDCYMQHTNLGVHKLHARSDKAILLGYCQNTNGFKVYYNNNLRVEQSVHFPPSSSGINRTENNIDQVIVLNEYGPQRPIPVFRSSNSSVAPSEAVESSPQLSLVADTSTPVEPVLDLTTRHSTRPSFQVSIERIRSSAGPKKRDGNRNNQALAAIQVFKDIASIPVEYFSTEPIGYKPSLKGPLAPFWAIERQK